MNLRKRSDPLPWFLKFLLSLSSIFLRFCAFLRLKNHPFASVSKTRLAAINPKVAVTGAAVP